MAYKVFGVGECRVPIKAWVDGVPFEESAIQQLKNLAQLPFIYKWVAAMPDVHTGKGATIGSVIATDGAVIPAAAGVDLGCGMAAFKTSLTQDDLPEDLSGLRKALEKRIPHGSGRDKRIGNWGSPPHSVQEAWAQLESKIPSIEGEFQSLFRGNEVNQLGTLGGGNHFVEVCLDEDGYVWLMLHSGSRGIGNRIGQFYIKLAKREAERWLISLPDKDLAYFPRGTQYFQDYLSAAEWAQEYARVNRELMKQHALEVMEDYFSSSFDPHLFEVNCHHNYVTWESHYGKNILVTRKGAIRAREGDRGIIPGSMGARSHIVMGKGNRDSFTSCSHGAGRKMSRGEARKTITMEEHQAALSHIECKKDSSVLDESPSAYKDIDAVMRAQEDLVSVLYTLHQVLCIKG